MSDELRSKQYAKILDLICEGPIVGLVNGASSAYLNETPVISGGGATNFQDVAVNWTTGTNTQLASLTDATAAHHFGLDSAQSANNVAVTIFYGTPVVRNVVAANLTSILVTLSTPQLFNQSNDGSIGATNLAFSIELSTNGGPYGVVVSDSFQGKTTAKYQRSYSVPVSGAGPFQIRVTKLTADSTVTTLYNSLAWDTYTNIAAGILRYPNSAIVAVSCDSQQFSAVPTRAYDVKGLIISIPTNYDPVARTYSGSWDGTFKQAWTDNPAWCFYDLLTNKRYGLGDYIDGTQVDKYGLYTIAQYCDVLVPSGLGVGTEPRFTCNLYLQSPAEAYQVIQNMASIFRAITFWSTGSMTTVQDSPSSAVALFSNANVIEGAFNYSGVSIKARHTVAEIGWNDPADFYRQKIEYVQDDTGVLTYGIKRTQLVAFGCTSRGQANRLGKWLLYSEKLETETVTFRAGLDGFTLYPGAIIKTSDLNRAGQRMGGRVVTATTTTVQLDSPVTIASGKTYTLSVIEPDGSVSKTAVTSSVGTYTTLAVAALSAAPQVNAVFVFEANDLVAEFWRVVGIKQAEHHLVEVSAIKHDPTKFAQVELGQKFDTPTISRLTVRPDAPTNLTLLTATYTINGNVNGLRLTLSWQSTQARYRVRYRQVGALWTELVTVSLSIDISNADNVPYEFQVYAINSVGVESIGATLTGTPAIAPPVLPALTGLALIGAFTTKEARIKWDAVYGANNYRVEIRDTATNTSRRIVNVGAALTFTYSSADMKVDGGPWRAITIYVTPQGQFGASSTVAGSLAITNPQIGVINGITLQGGIKSIFLNYTTPTDADFVGVQVWLSTDSACPAVAGNLVYDGGDTLIVLRALADGVTSLVGGTTYYVKLAGYDDFGKDSLTYSGSVSVVPPAAALDANSISAAMIQAGVLDATKFASSIGPVGIVTTLPAVAGYIGPLVVLNTSDGKLYRYVGGAWTKATDGADVIANSITAGQIAAGAITGTQIQGSSIGADKLIVGDLSNLLINPDFENADVGWTKGTNWTIASNVTAAYAGSFVAQQTAPATGTVTSTLKNNQAITVLAGDQFYARAYLNNVNATSTGYVQITGIDKAAVETVLATSPNVTRAAFTLCEASIIIPAGIIKARVDVIGTASVAGGMYADSIGLFRMSGVTLIQDGAISTNKIQAASITAAKLIANSITADKLLANSITAAQIAANTITADRLSVTALSAITANIGSVTSGDIYSATLHGGSGYPTNAYAWPTNGGNGFHLSASGLLLGNVNAGTYFQLDANGNLYAPQFSVVNGSATFSGNISAASGTFSGTLTAQQIITTGNLQNNSVTASVSAKFGSIAYQTYAYPPVITSIGGQVFISVNVQNGAGAGNVGVGRDGGVGLGSGFVDSNGQLTLTFVDTPGAGNHQYYLYVNSSTNSGAMQNATFYAIETKR